MKNPPGLRLSDILRPNSPVATPYEQVRRARYKGKFMEGSKSGFEGHALAHLYDNRTSLGIQEVYSCNSARVDGFLRIEGTDDHLPLLMEIKTTLSWGSLSAAVTQFLCGRTLLKQTGDVLDASGGLIVFNRFSEDWIRGDPNPLRPWAQLFLHTDELADTLKIWAIQLTPAGVYNPFTGHRPTQPLIQQLMQRHTPGQVMYRLEDLVHQAFSY